MARVGLWTVDSHFNPVEDFCQFDITRELVQSSLRSSSVKLWARVRSLSAGQVAKTTQTPPFGVLQARQHEEVAITIWGLPSGCGISQQGVFFPSLKESAATQPVCPAPPGDCISLNTFTSKITQAKSQFTF